jgi:sterol desaturase/sphingolipid hydroxylase (fatty acid hydroxylase superfamily)
LCAAALPAGPDILLLGDLGPLGTASTRLWPFHAVHHGSKDLDWLSAVRLHPVNDVVSRVAPVIPVLLLGFPPTILAAYVPFLAFWAIFIHANVPWSFGPLRYVIASPAFHRWHHTSEEEGRDKNFAGLFPFLDLVFGTFYLPEGRRAQVFGLANEDVPEASSRSSCPLPSRLRLTRG